MDVLGSARVDCTTTSRLKPKDLIGIPWRVAFALQADGWWLRQDIIWCLSGGAWLYARTPTSVGPMMLKDLVRLRPETVELWNGERWTRVTAWTKRTGRADAKELVLRSGERIGCTSNHVWPTQRGNLRTDALVKGDVIKTARLADSDHVSGWLTPEAFWFAGLYLAEGSRSGETIQIAGHIKEASRLARLRELIRHYGGSVRAYNHNGNSQNIHINSPALSAVLQTLIGGRTAKDKHLTARAWGYRNWALKELAQGYLDGDGHHDKANDRIRLGFARNYALERDLRCLAGRLGATLTLKPTTAKNQSGRTFPSFRGEWRWHQSGHHNDRDRGEVMEVRNSRARQFWDVTVADEPHLFALASGVLTHNSKPNPMPESVTDRCTKAHEYLFLLSKSERYHYDARAIAEPLAPASVERLGQPNIDQQAGSDRVPGKTNGAMKAVGGRPGGKKPGQFDVLVSGAGRSGVGEGLADRNRRSVWTVTTQPFSDWTETVRRERVERDAEVDGKKRTTSPDCPLHGDHAGRASSASCDGRASEQSCHNRRSDGRHVQEQQGDCAPTGLHHEPATGQRSSGLPGLSCAPSASDRSSGSHRTGHDPATSPACTASARTPARTGDTSRELASSDSAAHTHASNIEQGASGDHPSVQTPDHSEGSSSSEPLECTCEWYIEKTSKTSHFATFPPALIEPCILAGCPKGGTVLDPFGGAGTTGLVADRLGRNAILIELNPQYAAMAENRIRRDAPMFADVVAA